MVLVSVIMGVYNTVDYEILRQSVQSILSQTYKNFEFIICNDGSEDDTDSYLCNFSNEDSRIKLLKNNTNKGLAYTLNRCIEESSGEYIARMDADDIAWNSRLEIQVNFLNDHPKYGIVGTNAFLIDSSGRWGIRIMNEKPRRENFLTGTQFIHPSVMIRRSVFIKTDNYEDTSLTLRVEDYDFFMKAYSRGVIGYNIQKPLLNFREDKKTYSRRSYKNRLNEAKVRLRGFKRLGLMPIGYIYSLRPLMVGLVPQWILKIFRFEGLRKI